MTVAEKYNSLLFLFFKSLQRKGFALGLEDYKLLLEVLRARYPISNKRQLLQLCSLLWLKSEYLRLEFESVFNTSFASVPEDFIFKPKKLKHPPAAAPPSAHSKNPRQKTTAARKNQEDNTYENNFEENYNFNSFANVESLNQSLEEMAASLNTEDILLPTIDELPLSSQKLQSAWRQLKQDDQKDFREEIDLQATIKDIYQKGFFVEAINKKEKIKGRLFLLQDQGGSMIAFHAMSEQIVQSAQRSSGNKSIQRFYFTNVPSVRQVYRDPQNLKRFPVDQLLSLCDSHMDILFLISDAGAARGQFNTGRISATVTFLQKASKHIEHIIWINPMPKKRWRKTSAGVIAKYVQMIPATEDAILHAIQNIRSS